jgi:hypothetical protein
MKAPEVVMPAVAAGAVPELIAPADDVAAFLPEVTARLELLRAAYLSAAGLTVTHFPTAPTPRSPRPSGSAAPSTSSSPPL